MYWLTLTRIFLWVASADAILAALFCVRNVSSVAATVLLTIGVFAGFVAALIRPDR